MVNRISLEPEALKICEASSIPPLIFQLPPYEGRERLEQAQDSPVYMHPAKIEDVMMDTGCWGKVRVFVVKPECMDGKGNVIFYIHGAGWVFGSFHTHEKLVRELAARTNSVVVFPEYSRSPEVQYPVAIEQCYHILCKLPMLAEQMNFTINPETLTVAGDSVGGNMAIAMALMAKYRQGPYIQKQLLYYPVTNACFNTESYRKFAVGYYLYRAGMIWFWNQYTTSEEARNQITASPLRANCKQLAGLPATMILNGEADVLRDEGQSFAIKLREAGVDVTAIRFQGMIHDFVMLNELDQTKTCRAAMDVSTSWINRKNKQHHFFCI